MGGQNWLSNRCYMNTFLQLMASVLDVLRTPALRQYVSPTLLTDLAIVRRQPPTLVEVLQEFVERAPALCNLLSTSLAALQYASAQRLDDHMRELLGSDVCKAFRPAEHLPLSFQVNVSADPSELVWFLLSESAGLQAAALHETRPLNLYWLSPEPYVFHTTLSAECADCKRTTNEPPRATPVMLFDLPQHAPGSAGRLKFEDGLRDCLRSEGTRQRRCDNCCGPNHTFETHGDGQLHRTFTTQSNLPPLLFVEFKRLAFRADDASNYRNETEVDLSQSSISPVRIRDSDYELRAVACHTGSPHSGHSFAWVRNVEDMPRAAASSWLLCDDHVIRPQGYSCEIGTRAVLAVLVRVSTPAAVNG